MTVKHISTYYKEEVSGSQTVPTWKDLTQEGMSSQSVEISRSPTRDAVEELLRLPHDPYATTVPLTPSVGVGVKGG